MTARTIRTAAELDALPVGSVVLHVDSRGHAVAQRSVHDGCWYLAGAVERITPALPVTVLYDPSAPVVPVVSDAAGEAAREALLRECDLADADMRKWVRVPVRYLRAALTAALPHLAAVPSATREEVGEALHPGLFSLSDYEYARRFDNHGAEARARHQEAVLADEVDPLLARFTITPKETDR